MEIKGIKVLGPPAWNHTADRVMRWKARYAEEGSVMLKELKKPKDMQSLVGALVWDTRLRLLSMKPMREVFLVFQKCFEEARMPLAYEREVLQERFTRLMDDAWERVEPKPMATKALRRETDEGVCYIRI